MRVKNSYIYTEGVTPQTRAVISSRIKIFAPAFGLSGLQQVAVVGSMNQSHSRSAEPIRGIGYGDQIAELVPNVSDPISISFTRAAIYTSNIFQAFGYKGGVDGLVRSLKHHKWPFDIKTETIISELERLGANAATTKRAIITRFIGCWFTSFSMDFSSDSSLVMENADVNVTDILADEASSTYVETEDFGNSPLFSDTVSRVTEDFVRS